MERCRPPEHRKDRRFEVHMLGQELDGRVIDPAEMPPHVESRDEGGA
jgi:hypothetical protein